MERNTAVYVGQDPAGKLRLTLESDGLEGIEGIGWIALDPYLIEQALETSREAGQLEAAHVSLLYQWLASEEAEGRLSRRIHDVADHIQHVESISVYFDEELWSKVDGSSEHLALTELRGLLDRDLVDWTAREITLVAGLSLLFAAGGSIMFEEFNGKQFTATSVLRAIYEAVARNSVLLGRDVVPPTIESAYVWANSARAHREELHGRGYLFYRRINGLTLNKRQRAISLDGIGPLVTTGNGHPHGQDRPARARSVARDAIEQFRRHADSSAIEKYFVTAVTGAIEAIGADYGMTSGPRSLRKFRSRSALDESVSTTRNEFFCCCLPSERLKSAADEAELAKAMYRVSNRMQYNRWHFVPGNFAAVPQSRHYYYPPLMPDIATWSDARHGGHIQAGVRHTIRIPGPALFFDPLALGANKYRGFFDLRLVRIEGPEFRLEDLWAAIEYSLLIDVFWRVAADDLRDDDVINTFRREFYFPTTTN
ncbi:hypothetical protein AB0E69_23435 [Kribbella sp. NPDC026611]|uniref:hypothetical protein n=1 Tax=Kribbella sp. NPDC026611 TaxID=3154911 RepID=UPI0033E3F24E